MIIKTNAVDSFVKRNFGSGHGEGKLYLRGLYSDKFYRNFFDINAKNYGVTQVVYNGQMRDRENGPINNCYFLGSDIIDYLEKMMANPTLPITEKERLQECRQYFDNQYCYNFQVNYLFDSQSRAYIGSESNNFDLLRLVSVSQQTIVCMATTKIGIKFWLEYGQLD